MPRRTEFIVYFQESDAAWKDWIVSELEAVGHVVECHTFGDDATAFAPSEFVLGVIVIASARSGADAGVLASQLLSGETPVVRLWVEAFDALRRPEDVDLSDLDEAEARRRLREVLGTKRARMQSAPTFPGGRLISTPRRTPKPHFPGRQGRETNRMDAQKRLIVALDAPTRARALTLVETLFPTIEYFKIGSQLFTAEGPGIVREVAATGAKVFLDLKFHDIPNTVAESVASAARLGVAMVNVHAAGGGVMMREAMRRLTETASAEGFAPPSVVAVTVLTSSDQATLDEIGMTGSPLEAVIRLAKLTRAAGVNGVVASPQEIAGIRREISDPEFLIVTPGVRPTWAAADDQRRVMTPDEATAAGATHLVIGRPITAHPNPAEAAARTLEEMTAGA
jgi:orotidine-5'-phosphate decarboxylase